MGVVLPSINSKPAKPLKQEHTPHMPLVDIDTPRRSRGSDVGDRLRLSRDIDVGSVTGSPKNVCTTSHDRYPVYELIPGKLCITFHPSLDHTRHEIKNRPDLFFFSSNLHEQYVSFCKDFGPVNCATIYRFWQFVRSKEHHPNLGHRPLVYYIDLDVKKRANVAVLLGTYMMLEHKMSAADAASAFTDIPTYPFAAFRDATYRQSDFGIVLEDCLNGLEKAMKVGWFNKETFSLSQFEDLEDPEGGDVSLIGDKFIAFRGPRIASDDNCSWECPPSFYVDLFQNSLAVTDIVRLNEADSYDKDEFESQGFKVHDMEFADCTCPSRALVKQFLDVCDNAKGKVAVHCKAGLGRTGTMIGLWMMKNLEFTAREAIAFLRLCRPGCVIGQQQHYLAACENMFWEGNTLCTAFSQARRNSAASGAATPRSSIVTVKWLSAPTKQQIREKEALGTEVEQASRHRSLRKKGRLVADKIE
eukprot:112415-Rhodomonas_salina.2